MINRLDCLSLPAASSRLATARRAAMPDRSGTLDKVLLDITALTQLDSYCVTLIVRAHASLCAQGGDLKLLHPGGHVLEVFKTLHLLYDCATQSLRVFRRRFYGVFCAQQYVCLDRANLIGIK